MSEPSKEAMEAANGWLRRLGDPDTMTPQTSLASCLDAFAAAAVLKERERTASKLESRADKMRGVMRNDPTTIVQRTIAQEIRTDQWVEVVSD